MGRPNDGYVGLVANELPPRQSMKLDESLLLLVLRLHNEEAFTRFEAKEFGEVEVDSEQILQIYEDRTHRERPNFGRVKEILAVFRQRGLVRIEGQDDKNFTLFLRPALPIVVSKDTLGSLEEFVLRSRWEHEAVLEAVQARLDRNPDKMRLRRQTVEHPFGTIKSWMGATHFQMRTLKNVSTEMALHVLAYNMKRVMSILGVGGLMEAIRA